MDQDYGRKTRHTDILKLKGSIIIVMIKGRNEGKGTDGRETLKFLWHWKFICHNSYGPFTISCFY